MIVIFGGVYQGKLDYALERFGLSEADVFHCEGAGTLMPSAAICNEIDKWILALLQDGLDVAAAIKQFTEKNPDAIVICNDISSGVVPIDPLMRAWRESVGGAMITLCKQAKEVVRVFCGIATSIAGSGAVL